MRGQLAGSPDGVLCRDWLVELKASRDGLEREDPLHPWAQAALRHDGRSVDDRRPASTEGFVSWYKYFLVGEIV